MWPWIEPRVWKDGKEYALANCYGVNSLFVSGNDVYVAGQSATKNDSFTHAALWKNGTLQQLDNAASSANLIHVSGKDVYVAGTRGSGESQRPVLWKNGVEQKLQTIENPESLEKIGTTPTGIFVSGNDVYVIGARNSYKANGINHPVVPVLWKNGVAEVFPYHGYPTCIFVAK